MSEQPIEIKKKNRFVRALYLVLGLIIILFVVLYLALQITVVQNWVVDYVATRLSSTYNTVVRVDRVDIDFRNHLILDGLYIEDHQKDTMIYVGHFKTDLARSIWTLISKEMYIDEVRLDDAVVHLKTRLGESRSNFNQVFNGQDEESERKPNPWNLKIAKFYGSNIVLDQLDENKGQFYSGKIPQGSVIVNPNSVAGIWEIKNIDLQSPNIQMEHWATEDDVNEPLTDGNESEGDPVDSTKTHVRIRDLKIRDGSIKRIDRDKPLAKMSRGQEYFDPNHIDLNEISLHIKDINIVDSNLSLIPEHFSARSASGFALEEFRADKVQLSNKKIAISNMYLETDRSLIRKDLEFSFKDFSDFENFENQIYIKFDMDNSKIALNEIVHFVPSLNDSPFIEQNKELVASLDGIVSGEVNNLKIRNLSLSLGSDIYLEGDFRARNITDPESTLLNLKLDTLVSDVKTIKSLIPNFNPPEQFQRLGNFAFSGNFDGFYTDFVADGTLITDLGSANVDMHLDASRGRSEANYSGKIYLVDFDLGAWTGSPDLGLINGQAEVIDGYSLLPTRAKANLNALISSFEFKDYTYSDLEFKGILESGQLDGEITMDDENVSFDFAGSLTYGDQIPAYNFVSQIDRIDLKKLNLSNRPFVVAGKIEMDAKDLNLNTIDGDILLRDWTLQIDDSLNFYFDSLDIHSVYHDHDSKSLQVRSDIVDLDVDGNFILDKLDRSFLKMIQSNFPDFYRRFNLPNHNLENLNQLAELNQYFDFKIDVKDSQNLFTLLDNSPVDAIRDFVLKGSYNSDQNTFHLNGYTPEVTIDQVSIYGLALDSDQKSGILTTSMVTDSLFIDQKYRLRSLRFDNTMQGDTMSFRLKTTEFSDVLENLNIGGNLYLAGENFGLSLNSSELIVLDQKWKLSQSNNILFNDGFIRTSDLFASNGAQFLYVNSIKDKGLEIGAEYFDVDIINSLWDYDKLDFKGQCELYVRTEDIFNLTDFQSDLHLDSLYINGDHYGELVLDTRMNGVKMPIRAALNIVDQDKYLTAVGMVTPKGFGKPESPKTLLDMEVYLEDYPAKIIEYWLGDGIEQTKGIVDAELKLVGSIDRIDMSGTGFVQNAETKVIFLGTTYKLEDMNIPISNSLIDLDGGVLIDRYGNRATAVGGITHDKMSDLRLDIELKSDRFLALNTSNNTGDSFYGHALGKMKVNFDGSVDAPNIYVVGETSDSTEIFIPLEQANGLIESDFVVFNHDTLAMSLDDVKDRFKVSGINFQMNLEVNDKAKMQIIMDELGENIMSGVGNGNLQINMNRAGDFNVFGNYVIQEGTYIYSFENTIKRNFDIDKGGSVVWTGDPFNATVDIDAQYVTNTSITAFVEEFLASPESDDPRDVALRREAGKNQRVRVILSISGLLLQPQINFDLAFLGLPTGELGNAVNTKMNLIQSDQNLLNRQVLALLVFGGFLPDNVGLGTAVASSENLTNTVSEFLSYQLSKFISDVLHDAVTNSSFISDFGLTVDYKKNVDYSTGHDDDVFLVNPEFEFFDGKLNLSGGASYVNSSGINGQYLANDVILQFSLNKSKRLRAKLYQISDLELGARKLEFGAGISYQRNFDRFFFQRRKEEQDKNIINSNN